MALIDLHHNDASSLACESPLSISLLFRYIGVGFKLLHRGIVSAKVCQVRTEMPFRPDYDEMVEPERDASKFPRRPLILGDKWDF